MTCGLLFVLACSISESLRAEPASVLSEDFEPIHWAYSSFFGTGWYSIESARSVFALQVPFRQTIRESSLSGTRERKLGVEIRYPLTIGLHDVEDLGGIIDNDNFGTIAFAPGVELEIPINARWYLRPFAHIGWGSELEKGESAWVFKTKLRLLEQKNTINIEPGSKAVTCSPQKPNINGLCSTVSISQVTVLMRAGPITWLLHRLVWNSGNHSTMQRWLADLSIFTGT